MRAEQTFAISPPAGLVTEGMAPGLRIMHMKAPKPSTNHHISEAHSTGRQEEHGHLDPA